jgi:hypothetical protein
MQDLFKSSIRYNTSSPRFLTAQRRFFGTAPTTSPEKYA